MRSLSVCASLMATAMLFVGSANGSVMMFDDVNQNGWSADWPAGITTASVHSGSSALKANGGGNYFLFIRTGTTYGTNNILSAWLNTDSGGGSISLQAFQGPWDAQKEWNFHNGIYKLDGVTSTSGITLDSDTATWQHLEIDLGQYQDAWVDPMGWVDTTITSATVFDKLRLTGSGTTGNLLADDVMLTAVPEPSVLGLVGMGAALVLRRRR